MDDEVWFHADPLVIAIKKALLNRAIDEGKSEGGFAWKDPETGQIHDFGSITITFHKEKNKGGRPREDMKHIAVYAFCLLYESRELAKGKKGVDKAKSEAAGRFGYADKTRVYPAYNKGRTLSRAGGPGMVLYHRAADDPTTVFLQGNGRFTVEHDGTDYRFSGRGIYAWQEGWDKAVKGTLTGKLANAQAATAASLGLKNLAGGFEES